MAGSRRRCARCGGALSAYNTEDLCSPCVRGGRAAVLAVPERVWASPQVREALAEWDVGRLLRLLREMLQLPQSEIAELTGLSPTMLSYLESGARHLSRIEQIIGVYDALDVPHHLLPTPRRIPPPLVGAAAVPPSALTVAEFLPEDDTLAPLAVRTGRRVGAAQVADLARRVHGLRLADDVMSGKDLIDPALRELRAAVRLYREGSHTAEVGGELLRAIAEMAQIAGWVASDAGRNSEAEQIYRLGMSAAQAADDGVLYGYVAGSLAYQWSNTGRTLDGVGLARAALDRAGADAPPKARALYLDRLAWAYTRTGQDRPAMATLGEASEAITMEAEAHRLAPSYLYWVDPGELQVMEARVYTELQRPLRAVPLLTAVLGDYDASHARELALYLSWLAVAYADANEPEAAARTTARMLALGQSGSERTIQRTSVVLNRLQAFRDVPEVAELLRR